MTVTLYATMVALDGKREIVADLLRRLKQDVEAEPGNERFVVYTLADRPNHFHVEETYRDEAAFQAHMRTAHGLRFNAAIADLVENGRSEVVFLSPV